MGKSNEFHIPSENPWIHGKSQWENPMENPNGKIHHESLGFSLHVPGMGLNHLRSCSFGLCLWTAEDHRTWELPAGLAMEVSFAGGIGELIFQDFPARHVWWHRRVSVGSIQLLLLGDQLLTRKPTAMGFLFCCLRRHVLWFWLDVSAVGWLKINQVNDILVAPSCNTLPISPFFGGDAQNERHPKTFHKCLVASFTWPKETCCFDEYLCMYLAKLL